MKSSAGSTRQNVLQDVPSAIIYLISYYVPSDVLGTRPCLDEQGKALTFMVLILSWTKLENKLSKHRN